MATRIVEGQLPYTGGTGIEIDANKVIKILLRSENNLINVTDENELYTDLQLADGIKPTDEFPVGVTVGKVLASDGWWVSGMLLNMKTTSGDYSRWIYGGDGKLYFDNGTGTFTQIYSSTEVDNLLTQLRNSLATVAFTGDYNDLINRPQIVQLQSDWNQTDTTSPDYIKNKPSIPTKTSQLQNDSGFIDSNVNNLANYTLSYLFSAVATSGQYSDLLNAPSVIDNLTSTSTTDALSAAKGKELNDKINDLFGQGKFLSLWNAETGMPLSFPYSTPYNYSTGDYFLVENIGTGTNYRPDGASYSGTASTVVETDELEVGDVYIYDGQVWLLQTNHGKTVSFANLAGQPSDNTALSNALNAKANDADVVHKTGAETITGVKTFGTTNTWTFDGANATLYSPSSNGYLYVTRGGTTPVTMAIKSGTSGGTFGTTTNHQFQFRTNDVARMTLGTDGSVVLSTDVAANSNNNQVATTKWVNSKIPTPVTVGDGTLTLTQNGNTKGTFTANQSGDSSVALETTIPVTQSGYDALPASKTSDGNLYIIYG